MALPWLNQRIYDLLPLDNEGKRNYSALARHLGITPQGVQHWFDDNPETRTSPRPNRLQDIATYFRMSQQELQFPESKGQVLRGSMRGYDSPSDLPPDDYTMIRRRTVKFAAGNGDITFYDEPGPPLAFSNDYIRRHGIDPEQAVLVQVDGNSMEPFMFTGYKSLIALNQLDVRRVTDEHWTERIFAFRHGNRLRLKCLQVVASGDLRITSVNAEEHPPEVITSDQAEDVHIIGRQVWYTK